MIYVDDFLTRTWWDPTPEIHGLGRNIARDYDAMPVADELAALQAVRAMGLELMVFMVGCVLDSERSDVQDAIRWILEQRIPIAGHGYTHTAHEYYAGYVPAAERTLAALKRIGQPPPYWWRYPRHEAVNEAYVTGLGFQLAPYDHYLDPELNERRTLEVLRGHEHHAAWVHSVYVARVHRGAAV